MVARTANSSGLRDFLALLATVRGDLSSITAPPFILAPQSLVEFPCYWAERPRIFAAPALEPSAARRTLLVLKLYLTSLQRQYYVGRTVKEGLKKPLNPFLGEIFAGEYTDAGATTKVVSEQVSHHPPTTACFVEDSKNGVRASAYSTQSTTLSGASVLIKQSGHALLTVDKYNETYLIPLPDVRARGFLSGVPYPELDGTYKIISSSGYVAEMHFCGGSIWGGARNLFEASIYRTESESRQTPLYTLSGSWSDRFTVFDGEGRVSESVDLTSVKYRPAPLSVPSVEEMDPWESRRAWGRTVDALREGDVAGVIAEKSRLENAQRDMRKQEKFEERGWESAFFHRGGAVDDEVEEEREEMFDQLVRAGQLGKAEVERLRGKDGAWYADERRIRNWRRDDGRLRGGLTPFG